MAGMLDLFQDCGRRWRLTALALALCFSVAARGQWTESRVRGSPEPPPRFMYEPVFPGLRVAEGLEMTAVPGARRLAVVERSGKIWTFSESGDGSDAVLLVDLKLAHPELTHAYGLAFHPRWRENREIYVTWVGKDKDPEGSKLSRLRLSGIEPPVADLKSEEVLLAWLAGGHNGACLRFGPDGMLYVSTGDATAPAPPDALNTGQGVDDLLSCILRIDVNGRDPGLNYRVPPDNPFTSMPGARGEIWAFGFRNPWKMSFDAQGRLWCGDVGWELWEMIHLVARGGNHGWSACEASQPIKPETAGPGHVIPPIAAHPHTEAASITGGFVYEGALLPELRGAYVYGDYETGRIWALWPEDGGKARIEEIARTPHRIVTFGQDSKGEICWLDWSRETTAHRLVRNEHAGDGADFPRLLSGTGLFADTASQTPASGVLRYEVAESMWEDGAEAERFLGLPGGAPVSLEGRRMAWPADAVLARTIRLPVTGRRIETQLLHFDGLAWNGYSYRWNEAGTDAELVPAEGASMEADGQRWRFHSRAECGRCHSMWSGFAIGLQPEQLRLLDGRPTEQATGVLPLELWERQPLRLAGSRNAEAPLEDRARSWLHGNCAHCHRRHGGGSVAAMLNADQPLAEAMLLDEPPVRGDMGLAGAPVLRPGHPESSVLLARLATGGPGRMPMIGARELDREGFALLWDWVESLGRGDPAAKNPPPASSPPPTTVEHTLTWVREQIREGATPDRLPDGLPPALACFVEPLLPLEKRETRLEADFDPAVVLGLKGDPARGSELLSPAGKLAACLACHQLRGEGKDLGPALDGVGGRLSRAELLESLREPSKQFADGYETWTLTRADGSTGSGFLRMSDSGGPELRLTDGTVWQLTEVDRSRLQKLPISLMPAGLLAGLTAREAVDLLAFLESLREDTNAEGR
jgi:putative heme-binding domain-containing protein